MNYRAVLVGLLGCACAGLPPDSTGPNFSRPVPSVRPVPRLDVRLGELDDRTEAATAAMNAGLLPLHPTGVPQFSQLEPDSDGRGVLIAILDSGIDPDAPGLGRTSDGVPKLLDLRDFSGEGDIELLPVELAGDTISLGDRFLVGGSVLRRRSNQMVFAGEVAEVRYGNGPGADLNDNGVVGDTMLVVVARGTTTWVMWADSDGDGSIADERPVRDFAVAQEAFGWSSRGEIPPVGIAVTLIERGGVPLLTIVFDGSGHGTHVAGIAAGHDLYGVNGFDGVAPGARLLGLKISDNANRMTTSGSVLRALSYAVAFAKRNSLPLVVNLSFGVGNSEGSAAVIDRLVDSVLVANPNVVMTVAATNQGPGLGTLGFPATARSVLAVGATNPRVFEGLAPDQIDPDPIAWYSSRGGPQQGPAILAPGTAWSVVPRFLAGAEEKSGTSMAAPHVAGLVARLMSSARRQGFDFNRTGLVQALTATARSIPDASPVGEGSGIPDVGAAARMLSKVEDLPGVRVETEGATDRNAFWFEPGLPPATSAVRIWREVASRGVRIRLRSTATWLGFSGPVTRQVPPQGLTVAVKIDSSMFTTPGVRFAELLVENADEPELGPIARIPATIRVPLPDTARTSGVVAVQAGGSGRLIFGASRGRGFRVQVHTLTTGGRALVALHEPGGQPYREIPISPAGPGDGGGLVEVDAADVREGFYEVVIVAPSASGVAARVTVTKAPVLLEVHSVPGGMVARGTGLSADPLDIRLRAFQMGVAWSQVIGSADSSEIATPFPVPGWATQLVLDVSVSEQTWASLTDFGVSLRGKNGRLIQEAPLSYPLGRVRLPLPPGLRGDTLTLTLTPAFATPLPGQPWWANVTARFESDDNRPIDRGGTTRRSMGAMEERELQVSVPSWPLAVPAGWSPVVKVAAEEQSGVSWSREVILTTGQEPSE